MKPVDVTPSMCIDKENNKESSKFKVGNQVRISEYWNIFAKGYVSSWSEKVFIITKVRNTVPWTYVINDFKGEQIVGMFIKKELKKLNQKQFRVE